MQRGGVDHRSDDGLALHFLRVRQIEAALIDIAQKIRLLPNRVTAVDLRNRAHAPGRRRKFRRPFQGAGVPGISFLARLLLFRPNDVPGHERDPEPEEGHRHARNEIEKVEPQPRRVGENPPRHPAQPGDVHRQKHRVEAHEDEPEGDLAQSVG